MSKTKRRSRPRSRPRRRGGSGRRHAEENVDGCLCGIAIDQSDLTPDEILPMAIGGVAIPLDRGDDADADAAELEIDEIEATRDEELPPTIGGVAPAAP